MPEGPEVRVQSEVLNNEFEGWILINAIVTNASRYAKGGLNIGPFPMTLRSVKPYGKRIIMDFGETFLFVFLGMEGHFLFSPGKHAGVVFTFRHPRMNCQKHIFYHDSRHFGTIAQYNRNQLLLEQAKIGPDLLNQDVSVDQMIAGLMRGAKQPICEALVEQSYVSGIGNYARSEIMYLAKVHPLMLVGHLDKTAFERLHQCAISVLKESYAANGLTIATYVDPYGHKGLYQPKVYRRTTTDLGEVVQRIPLKSSVYWVPAMFINP